MSHLGVPIIAVVIAAFGALIAARQMRIADDKFQFDIFDRQYDKRFAVYEATRKILQSVILHNIIPDNEVESYGFITLDAQFLFDENMFKYLRELLQRITILNKAESKLAKFAKEQLSPSEERGAWEKIRTENLEWIRQQGDERLGFSVRFLPFLVFKQAKRPWWLRWP
jgi:hypothetical protein